MHENKSLLFQPDIFSKDSVGLWMHIPLPSYQRAGAPSSSGLKKAGETIRPEYTALSRIFSPRNERLQTFRHELANFAIGKGDSDVHSLGQRCPVGVGEDLCTYPDRPGSQPL